MQITVDINDESLKAAMEKGISGLSNEQLTEMAKEAMQAYMMDPKNINDIIFRYRNSFSSPELRPELFAMLTKSFTKEEVEEYRQVLFRTIDKHGDRLLVKTLAEIFGNLLMTEDMKRNLCAQMWEISRKE